MVDAASGRVVGARRIGDFAWSIENLLNRLIDGTLERNAAMLATLREGIAPPHSRQRRAQSANRSSWVRAAQISSCGMWMFLW